MTELASPLAHQVAAALYLAAAVAGWWAARHAGATVPDARWLLAAGIASHALALMGFHRMIPPVQLDSFPAALSLMGWLLALAGLLIVPVVPLRGIGSWIALGAFGFAATSEVGLRFGPSARPAAAGPWPHAHVILAAAGFSLLLLASLGGLAYLAKQRALKRKHAFHESLPSLESLDRIEHLGLVLGFPFLTLGVLTGFLWAAREGLSPWSPHSMFLIGAWLAYLVPITLRVVRGERGRTAARSVVFGFVVLAISYLGVRLLGGVA